MTEQIPEFNSFSYHLNKYFTDRGGKVDANNQEELNSIWEECMDNPQGLDVNNECSFHNFVFNLTNEYNVALSESEVSELIEAMQNAAVLDGKGDDGKFTLEDLNTEQRIENGEKFDVERQYNDDGTFVEMFYQNGTLVKSRNLDEQGRIVRGTHYDENGKETGHYERAFNQDGSFYDTWFDGSDESNYKKGTVTYRDASGNTLNEIRFDCNTGKPINPPPQTRVENGVTYRVETQCNSDGTYVETYFQDGVKVKVRNCNAQGRITGGIHYNEDGNVQGFYARSFNEDGSYVDIWKDNNETNARVETYRDAFGNTLNEIRYDENNQVVQ